MRLIILTLILSSASLAVAEEKPVDIPLKSIWAANMPGTRSIRDLEPRANDDHYRYGPLSREILRAIHPRVKPEEDAGKCFAVEGEGLEALERANKVLVHDEKRPAVLPSGNVTLIFYSRGASSYVHLQEASRKGSVITLKYRVVTHSEREITTHLALIPLGSLPPGRYQVEIDRLPTSYPHPLAPRPSKATPNREHRIVCLPSTFEVK